MLLKPTDLCEQWEDGGEFNGLTSLMGHCSERITEKAWIQQELRAVSDFRQLDGWIIIHISCKGKCEERNSHLKK